MVTRRAAPTNSPPPAPGSTYTRISWVRAFLALLGNPLPSPTTEGFVACWTHVEFPTAGIAATNNLLATCLPMPGSTRFNNACPPNGVQNYPTFTEGITANMLTLKNGLYPNLNAALTFGDDASLINAANNGIANDLNTWGTGNAATIANCARTGASAVYWNDTFSSTIGANPPGQNPPPAPGGFFGPLIAFFQQALAQIGGFFTGLASQVSAPFTSFLATTQPALNWLTNPIRIVKMVTGILLIVGAVFLLASPEVQGVRKALGIPK